MAGREELIGALRDKLTAIHGVAVVSLCGLGGVGKTTVAVEYAHRYADSYQVVWHFHAEDATGMLSQFHELAQVLDAGEGDPVAAVHTALGAHPGPWLLVLDNIRDHAAARRWMPAKGRGHVIVTTQDGHWPQSEAMEVSTISLEAAVVFLIDRTMSPDLTAATAIAQELGLLPLALAQAAAFVETTGRSLADYLNLLHTNRSQILARGAPAAHATPVVATYDLAMRELAGTNPGSITLLRIAAFLAPEEIPFRLLLGTDAKLPALVSAEIKTLQDTFLGIDDAVAGLRRHSLIGPPTETITVHRLVQAVTVDRLDSAARDAWRAAATTLVESAVPDDIDVREAWPVCRLLLPHAQLVADPIGGPMWRIASSFGASGDYTAFSAVWQGLATASAAKLGPEHPQTLTTREFYAYASGRAGNPAAALDLLQQLLPIRVRISGPEHPDTLGCRNKIAEFTGRAGDVAIARDMLLELLPIHERVLGTDHADNLTIRSNLAHFTGEAGDPAGARDLFKQLLPRSEQVRGREHPYTLATWINLAHFTGHAGDPAGARDMYQQLLPIQEKISGPEHPETLTARGHLANWIGKAGDPTGARDLCQQLHAISERLYGPEHPDALRTRRNFEYWQRLA